jgi:hypothetical protein
MTLNRMEVKMKNRPLIFVSLALLLGISWACQSPINLPNPAGTSTAAALSRSQTREAVVIQPSPLPPADSSGCSKQLPITEANIKYVLNFTGGAFAPETWDKTYTVGADRVDVTWKSKKGGKVAFQEYLVYSCGYSRSRLENDYSDAQFKTTLYNNYTNVNVTKQCASKDGKLLLHELTGEYNSQPYFLRYWVKQEDGSHLTTLSLVLPYEAEADLAVIPRQVFPGLSACP